RGRTTDGCNNDANDCRSGFDLTPPDLDHIAHTGPQLRKLLLGVRKFGLGLLPLERQHASVLTQERQAPPGEPVEWSHGTRRDEVRVQLPAFFLGAPTDHL